MQALEARAREFDAMKERETTWERDNEIRIQAQALVKKLQARVSELEAGIAQRDEALVDMAQELGRSKLKVSSLAQFKASAQLDGWVDANTVDACQQCQNAFNLVNRKVWNTLPATRAGGLGLTACPWSCSVCAAASLPAVWRRLLQRLLEPADEASVVRRPGARLRRVCALAAEQAQRRLSPPPETISLCVTLVKCTNST